VNVLSIAGSDPSSGAGIQGDIKTYSELGAYGLTIVTAVTSQNTSKFLQVEAISPTMITSQIESVLSDFHIDAIKIGMVYNARIIKVIHSKLKGTRIPIILDPVFKSTTGGVLLLKDAHSDFRKLLVPLSFVITPNIFEAEKLTGMKIRTKNDVKKAATKICLMGAKNVIIKGGHLKGSIVTDFLLDGAGFYTFSAKRIQLATHGLGCNFSAALAISIAEGNNLKDAVRFAKEFSAKSIISSQKIGKGIFITHTKDQIRKNLSDAISKFLNLKEISKYIPESQTNFVYSKAKPKSPKDILGISGRIVKAANKPILAGNITYGGSRHVALAVLEMTKKFPDTRSALNVKYDKELIKRAIDKQFLVLHYDRGVEPSRTKNKEGNTISWGIRNAIKNVPRSPDLIFHKGDFGKEPMILIFGCRPQEVITKLMKII